MSSTKNHFIWTWIILCIATVAFGFLLSVCVNWIIAKRAEVAIANGREPEIDPNVITSTLTFVIAVLATSFGSLWAVWQSRNMASNYVIKLFLNSVFGWMFCFGIILIFFPIGGLMSLIFSTSSSANYLFNPITLCALVAGVLAMSPAVIIHLQNRKKRIQNDDFDDFNLPPLK